MNIALFGYGYWGKKLRLILEQYGQVFIVDPMYEPSVTQEFILSNTSITHVFIATPEETHYELAMKCIQAGKHTFVEKPLCLFEREAVELSTQARVTNVVLFVDYTFLFDSNVHEIKRMIQSGEVGQPQHIQIKRHSPGINKPAITVFDDLAIHDIYLMRELFGMHPTQIKVMNTVKRDNAIVHADVHYQLNTLEIEANYSWIVEDNLREIKIDFANSELIWARDTVLSRLATQTSPLELCIKEFLRRAHSSEVASTQEYIDDTRILEKLRGE